MKSTALLVLLLLPLQALAKPPISMLSNEMNNIEVYQKVSPKVVFVHRYQRVMNESMQLFDVPAGAGSGFLWDNKGHIITNFHVVKGAHQLAISFGKTTVKATLVGAEPRKDIAVLKINSPQMLKKLQRFESLSITDSSKLVVGQKVLAIGNPFGLDSSLTTGVISAVGRKVPGIAGTIYDMIQTDASINPGNSGGPLLDSQGRLIGMSTAIYSSSGSSAGVGFAVPANDIKRIVKQIIQHGRVTLAGFGVQRIDSSLARRLGIDKGVLIGQVLKNSPASQAGIKGSFRNQYGEVVLGDVIIGVNGKSIVNYDDLYNLMVDIKVGEQVLLTLKRHSRTLNLKLRTIDIAKK